MRALGTFQRAWCHKGINLMLDKGLPVECRLKGCLVNSLASQIYLEARPPASRMEKNGQKLSKHHMSAKYRKRVEELIDLFNKLKRNHAIRKAATEEDPNLPMLLPTQIDDIILLAAHDALLQKYSVNVLVINYNPTNEEEHGQPIGTVVNCSQGDSLKELNLILLFDMRPDIPEDEKINHFGVLTKNRFDDYQKSAKIKTCILLE